MGLTRSAGVLAHVTSLPGRRGIGDAGPEARRFVDLLATCHVTYWQMLPLVPTGYADSPYAGLSAFAGNPLLISEDLLVDDHLLHAEEVAQAFGSEELVEYGPIGREKMRLLGLAFDQFDSRPEANADFEAYCSENAQWLDDFALYMAIKDDNQLRPWWEWESGLKMRQPEAIEEAKHHLAGGVRFHQFLQWTFDRQWAALKSYANVRGVQLIGDMPIFVAHDSADVWARRDLFRIDAQGNPEVVAGVPPDYFTPTGQLWGNPHYRWDTMRGDGFQWWIARLRGALARADLIRLDHFRGFAGAWAVPFGNATAEHGQWEPAPGRELFQALTDALGELPIIAEDLGFITPDVVELRQSMGWPGMQVLHFAFGGGGHDASLPHNYERNTVVYTGTSDSDTTVGWFSELDDATRAFVRQYLARCCDDISWDLARLAFGSVAALAVVPMQDLLRLGSEARTNRPGTTNGNWQWRFRWDAFTDVHREGLRSLVDTYGRDRIVAEGVE